MPAELVDSTDACEGGGFLAGRGIGDITGQPAGCGMQGYAKAAQRTTGIHLRQRARAFVIASGGSRVLLVVCDLCEITDVLRDEVIRRLGAVYGETYSTHNVCITATHTHAGPAGYGREMAFFSNSGGMLEQNHQAVVDGIVLAARAAHDDLAPSELALAHGELHDASTNRSLASWLRNPDDEREVFRGAVNPQTTVLTIKRDGDLVGAVNWFATHGTSMTNRNTLISGDNKGYAAYHWERAVAGVDYLSGRPGLVAAFAQTDAGDMSPNLNHAPGSGPTADEFENTRQIGLRQYEAAAALVDGAERLTGGVDARTISVRLSDVTVSPEYTGDGRSHRTLGAIPGAAEFAGTDEGPGFAGFSQDRNRFPELWSAIAYRLWPRLRDAQAPKSLMMPAWLVRRLGLVPHVVPIQLIRIGSLYLVCLPCEPTITAGLRIRRVVAEIVGADLNDVLAAGYSNEDAGYLTTPEEYGQQRYEGGATFFGRWQLPVYQEAVARLATQMRDGIPLDRTPSPARARVTGKRTTPKPDRAIPGHALGDVLAAPAAQHDRGSTVTAVFLGAHPNNRLRNGGTHLEVQRAEGTGWRTIADDGDWSTTFRWEPLGAGASRITLTWTIPADAVPGRYRLRYLGDAVDAGGRRRGLDRATDPFDVR
ncbi:neutral/alkaline non-lysosomal ceramidase N-terminal domain-containing protein [Microbacterium sp. ASV49]|uniref:Neutral ceramidase n=1 Tax=Microbacterium candidum TaxID=3041922 RepID=A0ABT7MUC8_9MICO|nr:neutral/alkaline non-lysosomal ceramidase N-terminal domain-containing protein [Microbacterium sp. ASV49]MDL9978046.1 neutral/alkaline non-lysosomal ceramidase N-terminal domain-containing protein [Microbacterium sp. ASV49]